MHSLSRADWHRLKEALLGASSGDDSYYEALPDSLKEHEIGQLIGRGRHQKNARAFNRAAVLLTGRTENAWLMLDKS